MPMKTKLSSSSHCRNATVSSTSDSGSGGWSLRKSVIAPRRRARIARQSVGHMLHIGEQRSEPLCQRVLLRGVADQRHVEMHEALARHVARRIAAGRREFLHLPHRVAPHLQDGVDDEADGMAGGLQLAEDGIEDERPVGGEDLDRAVGPPLQIGARKVGDAHHGRLVAAAEEGEGVAADPGERLGVVFDQVLARGMPEEDVREGGKRLAFRLAGEALAERRDAFPAVVVEAVRHAALPSSGAR